jgi:hypothetical protein
MATSANSALVQALIGPQKPKDIYTSQLIKGGLSTEPVGHWTQGAARIVQALLGASEMRDIDQQEQATRAAPARMASIYSDGDAAPTPQQAPPPQQRALPRPSPVGFAPPAPPMAGAPSAPGAQDSFNDRFNAAYGRPLSPSPQPPVVASSDVTMNVHPRTVAQANGLPPPQTAPQGQRPPAMPPLPRDIQTMLNDRNPNIQAQGLELARAWRLEVLKGNSEGGSNEELGLNPIWGTGPDGKPMIVQLGKRGTVRQPQMPQGFQPGKPLMKTDTGTQIIYSDPISGQVVKVEPKDVAGAAREGARGKDEGEARALLDSMISKMPGLESVVKELDGLSTKATHTFTGQAVDFAGRQLNLPPREAAVARQRYISMVDNQVLPMLRDTFGAAFTVKEGETLRATLGNPDLSPQEKQAVLKSFIEQKRRDIEGLQRRAGPQQSAPTPAPSANDPLGLR